MNKPANTDEYIATFPPPTQALLQEMRKIILSAAPAATEVISYGMPAFKQDGYITVWFAGYAKHIGFYPSSAITHFKEEISAYKNSKGAVQFPLDEPLPEELIKAMVRFKIQENLEKAAMKNKK
ncbi:iron chaperone [Mucilaginibacter myungsuensis]|uniref:DUF1801 domain-containing protein n=1 Tax=Mucilaginibacter myungsuensis TaxID=649104 RepID=A0A929KT45_9SPHI|nr:DUF1801 domain-containing protein [Mucilaginibacter myungsuensis]MBE9661061.1 DUF1801 domain-containing protein [Mucilaginibacter myungsuensis]MDN3597205.1 DUF1801 domain-containing protein [Mucilaginibacter myungsuensis]